MNHSSENLFIIVHEYVHEWWWTNLNFINSSWIFMNCSRTVVMYWFMNCSRTVAIVLVHELFKNMWNLSSWTVQGHFVKFKFMNSSWTCNFMNWPFSVHAHSWIVHEPVDELSWTQFKNHSWTVHQLFMIISQGLYCAWQKQSMVQFLCHCV